MIPRKLLSEFFTSIVMRTSEKDPIREHSKLKICAHGMTFESIPEAK